MSLLEMENVSKSYSAGIDVLAGLDFQIEQGEVVAIIGPSGSGKSTFLKIAGLLDLPSTGAVRFAGRDCSKLTDAEQTLLRRKNLGFIYQQHCLLPEFTAMENLVIPQLICNFPVEEAHKRATLVLSGLNMQDKANSRPSQLSGGEQQRIAVLRGVINSPQLLLADEPTGNLDPHNSRLVVEVFLSLVRSIGLAVIIVTHNLAVAARADRIMELRDGKLMPYSIKSSTTGRVAVNSTGVV
ncbi:MAG: ABC transporter ATP-binding protein [Proteobacteria bacterium]|nr:ABC transporter ATP-binding protein [Pseudomonadota bacterium]